MEHESREENGISIVAFRGDVDLENSRRARDVVLGFVSAGKDLIVDLSGVTYIDSSGIASLVEAFQQSRKQGTHFALAAVSPAALRVFQLARLDTVFTIVDSVEAGLAHGG